MMNIPLAERMRPKQLDDYIGQEHLVGDGAVLRSSIKSGQMPSIIFWGPPGVGIMLSAINSGVKEVRETIKKAEGQRFFTQGSPVLFIDEIHRFSKSQQDSLLGAVEKGIVTLIGATTENPSFEVISALLSRCQVYVLNALAKDELKSIVDQALEKDEHLKTLDIQVIEYEALYKYSNGDARRLLNVLELVMSQGEEHEIKINNAAVEKVIQSDVLNYDKTGDQHYDTISAFIKSVRGSHPDAAIYYLARMIAGGEDPKFICRRLIILAAEDIGLANPNALLIANACFDAVQKIGLPEGRIPMAQATVYLATSPKSNSAYAAIGAAMKEVKDSGNLSVPLHLRNAPTSMMKDMGYGSGYVYTHQDTPGDDYHYLPKEISHLQFYDPKDIGAEKKIYQALKGKTT